MALAVTGLKAVIPLIRMPKSALTCCQLAKLVHIWYFSSTNTSRHKYSEDWLKSHNLLLKYSGCGMNALLTRMIKICDGNSRTTLTNWPLGTFQRVSLVISGDVFWAIVAVKMNFVMYPIFLACRKSWLLPTSTIHFFNCYVVITANFSFRLCFLCIDTGFAGLR